MNKQLKYAAAGAITGILNGFFGSGGGVAAVLLLKKLFNCDTKSAHATAIMVILPLSAVSIIIYLIHGKIPLLPAVYTSIGGICGGFTGAVLLKKAKSQQITKIFGLLMISGALRMLFPLR